MHSISRLTDVIDPDVLKYICLGYAQQEGIPLRIVQLSEDAENPVDTLGERPLEFCRRIKSLPNAEDLCHDDCGHWAVDALQRNEIHPDRHRCHNGMMILLVPIIIGGKVVAVVTGGQGRPAGLGNSENMTGESPVEIQKLAPKVESKDLERIFQSLKRVSELIRRIGIRRYEEMLRREEDEFFDQIADEFRKPRKVNSTLNESLYKIFEMLNKYANGEMSGLLIADSAKADVFCPKVNTHPVSDDFGDLFDHSHNGRFYHSSITDDIAFLQKFCKSVGIEKLGTVYVQSLHFMNNSHGLFFWITGNPEMTDVPDELLMQHRHEFFHNFAERIKSGVDVYEADRKKDDFMAEMTHRLKAPMQSILAKSGFLNFYSQKKYPEDTRIVDLCREMAQQINVLNDQTKNFTFITTLDKGGQEYNLEPYPIMTLIADCIERVRDVANARGIEVEGKLDGPPGHAILIDRPKIELVFNNLLDNAIKYSHSKKRIEIRGIFDWKRDICRILVSSFGLGISSNEYELIFQRYYRAHAMRDTRRYIPGTGIGLTVVREIVRGHGGDIQVESHRGAGETGMEGREGEGYKTTFTIELPIRTKKN